MPQKIKTFDIILSLIPILLLSISIAVIYSLVYGTAEANLAFRQGIFSIIGIAIMFAVSFLDYRIYRGINWLFYLIVLILLVYVDFFGKASGGAMRWIDLGFFQLQPSELAKVVIIISLSSFFCQKVGAIKWSDIIISFLILLPPLALILKEPDLGTALVVCVIYIVILFAARPKKLHMIVISAFILSFASIVILSAFNVKPFGRFLHDYQRNRILTFVDPSLDPYGKGYNVKQAQIAVGSGGIFGKGLGKGSQSQLQFLPKPQTDFIFSGISESFGFTGTILIVGLFALLLLKIISIGHLARDNFGTFIAFGAAATLSFQIIINIGMNIGIAPVTGIPLPFSSYGGSALVAYLFLIGLVQSVYMRHKKISF